MLELNKTHQTCKKCNRSLALSEYPKSQMHKLGVSKTCYECLKGKKAGQVARSLIKSMERVKGARPKTPQQLRSIASAKEFEEVKKKKFAAMLAANGGTHYHCEHSGIIIPAAKKYLLCAHHIVFQSELKNHPEKHNEANIIIVLRYDIEYMGETIKSIHDWYHDKKSRRKKLVEERNLEELFGSRISFYHEDING